MKFTTKVVAKMMLIVAIGLLLLLIIQQPSSCEAFQAAPPTPEQQPKGTIEIPIPAKDLEKQTFTVPIPKDMESKKLTNIYFKLWNVATKKWGPMLDASKLPKTFDEGDSTLTFASGKMRLRKQGAKGVLGNQKALPVPVNQLDKGGITINGLNNANFGTLPASGDSSGAKVAVGLVFA